MGRRARFRSIATSQTHTASLALPGLYPEAYQQIAVRTKTTGFAHEGGVEGIDVDEDRRTCALWSLRAGMNIYA